MEIDLEDDMDIDLDDTREEDDREAEDYVDSPPPRKRNRQKKPPPSPSERAKKKGHVSIHTSSYTLLFPHTGASKRQRCTRSMSSSMCGNTLASISSPTLANVGSLECPMDCVKLTILEPACILETIRERTRLIPSTLINFQAPL